MFSRTVLFVSAFMAVIVAASPAPDNYESCNTGTIQCCQQFHDAQSTSATTLLGLIGIPANGLTGQIGTSCTPITPIGLGSGANCRQAPMCCSDNKYNGLVVVGCNPINASL
ncbi:fungal hydrophobin-domain-containing protein [Collybia nuda]|uniref:Hydrophobin n=1 Tax=Collybia nuda TaxID=64659 RepID=A0A9P6CH02_9AGAR|nr:fungal hydrophobin-domain-containing protein [Collybia nuda]